MDLKIFVKVYFKIILYFVQFKL